MKKILVLDNYDSFTYNLVHALNKNCDYQIDVYRNDEILIDEIEKYDAILLSPGPGIPEEAGILLPVIRKYAPTKKIFGVCLGLQAIGEAFGGKLINMLEVYHGIKLPVNVISKEHYLFKDVPPTFIGGRYHSWIVDSQNLPPSLEIIATDNQDRIMAIRHRDYDVCGVQFHPESVMTEYGNEIIVNWINNL
jgi:anthranilate synthase component II